MTKQKDHNINIHEEETNAKVSGLTNDSPLQTPSPVNRTERLNSSKGDKQIRVALSTAHAQFMG